MTAALTRPPHPRPARRVHYRLSTRQRRAVARTDRRITCLIRDVPDGAARLWRLVTSR